jgi:hypothetical protein
MAARINFDRSEGFTDVSDISGMFAFGATDRIELFGSVAAVRRIDVDNRPLLQNGQPMDYMVNNAWSTGFGDITIGAKFNVLSQATNNGVAFAIRAMAKLPTASRDDGLGTGKADFIVDGILSREFGNMFDLAGYAGLRVRQNPSDYDLSNGLRYGAGFGWPSRSRLKMFGELSGEYYFDNTITFTGTADPALGGPPASWTVDRPADVFLGVQYHAANGFYVGTGVTAGLVHVKRQNINSIFDNGLDDKLGFQVRIGFHPGVRTFAPAPPPPPPPPPPPAAAGQPAADGQGALRALHRARGSELDRLG